jgi:hypothetical protein
MYSPTRNASSSLGPDAFDGDAHGLLTLVYRDTSLPLDVRIHAATVAISYESPRLAVIDARIREETAPELLNDAERREKARKMIEEAFKERPQPVIEGKFEVIAGTAMSKPDEDS